jgi:hypothetical protein
MGWQLGLGSIPASSDTVESERMQQRLYILGGGGGVTVAESDPEKITRNSVQAILKGAQV